MLLCTKNGEYHVKIFIAVYDARVIVTNFSNKLFLDSLTELFLLFLVSMEEAEAIFSNNL